MPPSTTFPRTVLPADVSMPSVPGGLVSRTESGKTQTRGKASGGRVWTEVWGNLLVGDPNVDDFLAWIEWAYNTTQSFSIKHKKLPGSDRSPNGLGGGTPLVNGANQTGQQLVTDGWAHGVTKVVASGDVIRVGGIAPLLRIVSNANSDGSGNCTIDVIPLIYTGKSPADNAAITTTGCTMTAILGAQPSWPNVPAGGYITGLSLTFWEVV